MNTKQVIVMRKDLNMRKGKMIAQGSHASMAFLTRNARYGEGMLMVLPAHEHQFEVRHWLDNSFRKITVYVNSEEELRAIHEDALFEGLVSHLIEDNGATEFGGVKTLTCCAIGPHYDHRFVGITDSLPLL